MLRHWRPILAILTTLVVISGCSSLASGKADSAYADAAFSANSWADLTLGDTADDIRVEHADFPAVADTGSSTVEWQRADLAFDSGALNAISPHGGGKTGTGITVGSTLAEVEAVYGAPVGSVENDDGTATAVFLASIEHKSGFQMELDSPAGPVRSVTLCNCLPEGWESAGTSANRTPPTQSSGQGARAEESSSDSGSISGTQRIVVRPVDANGNITSGFTIDDRGISDNTIYCGDESALSAVDNGVFYCSPNAAAAHSCWPSPNPMQVLCLMDPFESTLTPMALDQPLGSAAAPGDPTPLGLVLEDGTSCTLRHGGAWGSRGDLYPVYGCDREDLIWTDSSDPIDKSNNDWQVLVGAYEGPLRNAKVTKAYYVGNA